MILFGDPGDEQAGAWLDESMRSAKAESEATPGQLRREHGDTKANAEPFAQKPVDEQPARDPLRPVAGTVIEGLVAVYDKGGRFLAVTTMDDTTGWRGVSRLYRCRVVIEGEVG